MDKKVFEAKMSYTMLQAAGPSVKGIAFVLQNCLSPVMPMMMKFIHKWTFPLTQVEFFSKANLSMTYVQNQQPFFN